MTARKKAAAKRKSPARKLAPKKSTVLTAEALVRNALRKYEKADLVFAHGTTDPVEEVAFLLCETLGVHPAEFERVAKKAVRADAKERFDDLISQRIVTRKPAAYLVNKMYMLGQPFYIDERTIVPRSFIGELLDTHFSDDDDAGASLIDDSASVKRVLDLCTGSGCLAILAAQRFPNAKVDAVDISEGALSVAARNVDDYGLQQRVTLHRGDLFSAIGDNRYDLIVTNPPYVDADGMAGLPRECRHEPELAFDGGIDGLDLVRRILDEAKQHLTPQGGLLCEVGRGRQVLEDAYPHLPLLWLDTEDSEGEVFWIAAEAL